MELFNTCSQVQAIEEERWNEAQESQSKLESAEARCQNLAKQLTYGVGVCQRYKRYCADLEFEVKRLRGIIQTLQWEQWQCGVVSCVTEY